MAKYLRGYWLPLFVLPVGPTGAPLHSMARLLAGAIIVSEGKGRSQRDCDDNDAQELNTGPYGDNNADQKHWTSEDRNILFY